MATLHRVVHGCHDCPLREVHAFIVVTCAYAATLPTYQVVGSKEPITPPEDCPLRGGGTVTLILALPEPPPQTTGSP